MPYQLYYDDTKTGAGLAKGILEIPAVETSLDLSRVELHTKTGAELAHAFAKLHAGVTSIDLGGNELSTIPGTELAEAFAGLQSTGVTTISLRLNALGSKDPAELIEAFKALPSHVTTINLSHNSLYRLFVNKRKTPLTEFFKSLAEVFKSLPAGITSLDLSSNFQNNALTFDQLRQLLKELPTGLTSLNLSENKFHLKTRADLVQAFAELPAGITSLNLDICSLGYTHHIDLAQIFTALPAGMTFLSLRNNILGSKSGAELAQAFAGLHPSVTSLDLSDNDFDKKTDAELDEALAALPITVKSLVLNDKVINLDAFRSKLKEKILQRLEPQLLLIKDKAENLKTRKYDEAYNAAQTLYLSLTNLKSQYSNGTIEYVAFKNDSIKEIKTARVELEIHRGWKEILSNVLLCILGLGIGYLAICAYEGSFFKFNTDSAKKLDDLQNTIDPNAPTL